MGREFDELFKEWAPTYDDTVMGNDVEYREVFRSYDQILDEVASRAAGTVLEFGVGTGNLTKRLIDWGYNVYGIEPSEEMRLIATEKIRGIRVKDGDFIDFPEMSEPINTIVSSYAFHHLTDLEKDKAISIYADMLKLGDKIVFADTVFENEQVKLKIINASRSKGYFNLVRDLETEYYSTIPLLGQMFKNNGFDVSFKQMNDFVWIIEAIKK